jgi:hypothetical protein
MADEEKTATTATNTGTQPGTSDRTFTQAEVDEIVKNRMRKEFKREAKRVENKADKEAKPDKPSRRELDERKADRGDIDKVLEKQRELERKLERAEFNAALHRDGRFREDSFDDIWTLQTASKPKDQVEFLNGLHGRGAFLKPAKQDDTQTQSGNQVEEKKAGATAPRAPSTAPAPPTVNGGLTDIWNMSAQQVASYTPQQLRGEFEKILEAGRQITGAPPRPRVPGK